MRDAHVGRRQMGAVAEKIAAGELAFPQSGNGGGKKSGKIAAVAGTAVKRRAMMPGIMDNLMPHMVRDVVPLVSQPLVDYLQGRATTSAAGLPAS